MRQFEEPLKTKDFVMVHGNAFDMVERMLRKYLVLFRQHHDLAKWQEGDCNLRRYRQCLPRSPIGRSGPPNQDYARLHLA
eukprot:6195382-Pleurochrysis_carterae.AAC.1